MKHVHLVSLEAAASAEEAARRNHYEAEIATESFWKKSAASLPPHVRRRYGRLFEAAEQYEPVIEFIVNAFSARRGLLGLFRAGRSHRDGTRQKHKGFQERSAF